MNKKDFMKKIAGFIAGLFICFSFVFIFTTMTGMIDWRDLLLMGRNSTVLTTEIENKMRTLDMYIESQYLDKVDSDTMEDKICKGMIAGLGDDYAAYYNKEEYKLMKESTSGSYCGIGAYVSQNATTGAVTIVQPIEDSPAQKAGLKKGDIVSEIDGKDITGEDLSTVVSKMKGEPGTTVEITIIREGENKPLEFKVKREKIENTTVEYKMLDEKIGYIAVSAFEENTAQQFTAAVDALEKQGEKALIIDLRNNGGGLLDTAVSMLDRLLPKEEVVSIKNKQGEEQKYYAEDDTQLEKPIAIVVNGYSASASEVFSGAMQDYKKAVLIGTQTFGKGIVQSVYGLSDGTAVKLTTAKYYTPKGRNIHKVGLTPDVEVELNGEVKEQKHSKLEVDNQLQAAIDYLDK